MDVRTPQSICRAGLSRRDITPPIGIYHRMWGASDHAQATGVHRPLVATALVLTPLEPQCKGPDRPAEELVLVGIDHCMLWGGEMQSLRARVAAGAGVDPARLCIALSHTHGVGLYGLERRHLPGGELIEPYFEQLAAILAEAVREARNKLEPATIVYGTGRCALATHRDLWDPDGEQYVSGYNPDGPTDDTVLVARITSAANQPLGTIVNYACHPTTLAWGSTLLSPDFVGAMREVVESATGGAPCLFLQGAGGDLGPREGFTSDVAVADRNGRQLGYAAMAAIEALPPPATRYQFQGAVVSGATVGLWAHMPLDASERQPLARWQVRPSVLPLAYRKDLLRPEQVTAELKDWSEREQAARSAGDLRAAADACAQVERSRRWQSRLATLPAGKT
ncbi:MAG TPA: hypothetical protein VHY20_02020, partial [Pirellulales bacterium]|nr:hypothetical protein [Pirellulales bacterium]